jgi:hypothetical protein
MTLNLIGIIKIKNEWKKWLFLIEITSSFIRSHKRGRVWKQYPSLGEAFIMPSHLLKVFPTEHSGLAGIHHFERCNV